jgi:copper chaperone NosL
MAAQRGHWYGPATTEGTMADRIKRALEGFYAFVDKPLYLWTRPVLVLLLVPLVIGLFSPLWHIAMEAPQYPNGLSLDIYAHTVQGGHDGADISEINILNHYIGMKKLDRSLLTELDWLPFGFGALGLLLLRVAALGDVRALLDLSAITLYFSGFSVFRFVLKMHAYGHDLAHDAPIKIQPFMPVIWGTKPVGNFTTHAYPGTGSYLISAFALGIFLVTALHLFEGRRRASRDARAEAGATPPADADAGA